MLNMIKKGLKIGDEVMVTTSSGTIFGKLMPSSSKYVMLKLSSGYNISLKNKDIKKIKLVKKMRRKEGKNIKIKHKKGLPKISILHTGGTIASKVNYETGGVIASFSAKELLNMFPELGKVVNVSSREVFNIMSEDLRFKHYKKLAKEIVKDIKNKVDGIIVGHGTDTLAITASALDFMFEKLPIPLILVGSQRSSDRGSSDANMNLVCAAEFIKQSDFVGVAICMHENMSDNNCVILPATKTRKLHTSRRDAFKAVNVKPLARINYKNKKIEYLDYKTRYKEKVSLKDKFEEKVGIIKVYPNISKDVFEVFRKKKYKGLILEGSGIGQAPTNIKENLPIHEELKKFIKSGGIVVMTSQCIFGRVHPNIYTNCRRLADIGVIYAEDMLTETAFIKLAWLLGNYKKNVKEMVGINLRGEIAERIKEDFLR